MSYRADLNRRRFEIVRMTHLYVISLRLVRVFLPLAFLLFRFSDQFIDLSFDENFRYVKITVVVIVGHEARWSWRKEGRDERDVAGVFEGVDDYS